MRRERFWRSAHDNKRRRFARPGDPRAGGAPRLVAVPPGRGDDAREAPAAARPADPAQPGLGRARRANGRPARLGGGGRGRGQRAAEPGRRTDLHQPVRRRRHRGQRVPGRRPGAHRGQAALPGRHHRGGHPDRGGQCPGRVVRRPDPAARSPGEANVRGRRGHRRRPGHLVRPAARVHRRGGHGPGRQPARPAARRGLPQGGLRAAARDAAPRRQRHLHPGERAADLGQRAGHRASSHRDRGGGRAGPRLRALPLVPVAVPAHPPGGQLRAAAGHAGRAGLAGVAGRRVRGRPRRSAARAAAGLRASPGLRPGRGGGVAGARGREPHLDRQQRRRLLPGGLPGPAEAPGPWPRHAARGGAGRGGERRSGARRSGPRPGPGTRRTRHCARRTTRGIMAQR